MQLATYVSTVTVNDYVPNGPRKKGILHEWLSSERLQKKGIPSHDIEMTRIDAFICFEKYIILSLRPSRWLFRYVEGRYTILGLTQATTSGQIFAAIVVLCVEGFIADYKNFSFTIVATF